jgi:hypothetical protein
MNANEFIDSLGLDCGDELKERLGDKGWEWAKQLHDKNTAMQEVIYSLFDIIEQCEPHPNAYVPHEVIGLTLQHDIDLAREE